MMDTIEKFYVYRETKLNNQINEKLTVKLNVIFETIAQQDPHRGSSLHTTLIQRHSLSPDKAVMTYTRKNGPKKIQPLQQHIT